MPSRRSASLGKRFPHRTDVPMLLTICAACLTLGITLPALETRALFWHNEYSILGNIQKLLRDDRTLAAAVLICGSIVYPAIKIGLLSFFWLFPFPSRWRSRSIQLLRFFSRWGMIDVITVTAIVLASMTIGPLHATPKIGLYVYAVGIFALMFTGMQMARLAQR